MVTKLSARKTPVAKAIEVKDSALKAQLHGYVDNLFDGTCSVRRAVVAFVAGMAAALSVGAIGGVLSGLMMIGAIAITWPMFVVLTIYMIGVMIATWLSGKAFTAAYDSVIDRSLETTCIAIKNGVTERFARITNYFTSKSTS